MNFGAGRKTAWNWQETSHSSIASRKTAANTSWSSTRPQRKTAATTRLKRMVASLWLNSWCRVSGRHARVQREPLLSVTNTPSAHSHTLPIVGWPCHSWHAVYLWDMVPLAIAHISLPRLLQVHMPAKVRWSGPYFTLRVQVCTSDPVCFHCCLCWLNVSLL